MVCTGCDVSNSNGILETLADMFAGPSTTTTSKATSPGITITAPKDTTTTTTSKATRPGITITAPKDTTTTTTTATTTTTTSTTIDTSLFYVDWRAGLFGMCVQNCVGPAPCGGINARPGEEFFPTAQQCCEDQLPNELPSDCTAADLSDWVSNSMILKYFDHASYPSLKIRCLWLLHRFGK